MPAILAEVPRRPELKGAFSIFWENVQVAVKIIQAYQLHGILKEDSPLPSLNSLLGPLMTSQMFRRADLGLPTVDVNPTEYIDYFLQGRKK